MLRSARLSSVALAALLLTSLPAAAAEDPRDKAAAGAVLQSVLEKEKSGVEVPWSSALTGNAGTVEVTRTFFPTPERPCRDYIRTTVTPAGAKTTVRGTGCRNGPEEWTLEEETPATAAPEKKKALPKKAVDKTEAAPKKEEKAEAPAPAKEAAEKAAPPLLEYSLPTSSTI